MLAFYAMGVATGATHTVDNRGDRSGARDAVRVDAAAPDSEALDATALDTVALDTVALVETPEHVRFSFELAGPARRAGAYVIDLVVRSFLLGLLVALAALAGLWSDDADLTKGVGGISTGLWLVMAFFMEWGYFVLLEMLMGGQSVGKRALRLRVVSADGRPLSFTQSVLRNLLRAADFLPASYAIGLVVMVQERHFRRLGDLVGNTLVIVDSTTAIDGALTLNPSPTTRELQAIPGRPDLQPEDLKALELFLRRLGRYPPAREIELAEIVAPIYAARMGLTYQDPVRFLALLYQRATASSHPNPSKDG